MAETITGAPSPAEPRVTQGRLCHTQLRSVLRHASMPSPCMPSPLRSLSSQRTGVDVNSYADLAVRLANSANQGCRGGNGLATVQSYRTIGTDRPPLAGKVTPGALEALRLLRGELRLIFTAAERCDGAQVAERLNALLTRHPIHQQIVSHDGQHWHIHLVESGSAADRHAAGAIAGPLGLVTGAGTPRPRAPRGSGSAARRSASEPSSRPAPRRKRATAPSSASPRRACGPCVPTVAATVRGPHPPPRAEPAATRCTEFHCPQVSAVTGRIA